MIDRLVYQDDQEVIQKLMSIMVLVYVVHTLFIVPLLAVSDVPTC